MRVITEYQYQQLRNRYPNDEVVKEVGRQPLEDQQFICDRDNCVWCVGSGPEVHSIVEMHSSVLSSLSLVTGDVLDYSTSRSGDDECPDHREDLEEAISEYDHEVEDALMVLANRILADHIREYPRVFFNGKIAIRAIRDARHL